jgi:DoxX-like family
MGRASLALTEQAMTIFTQTAAGPNISNAARWTGRVLSGVVILFLLLDGAMKLLPLQVVTETMDKMGWGASDNLARGLGIITIVCSVLYAVPPTSILGAILLTGYLGGAIASHVRIDSPLFSHTLFGLYLGLIVWGGLWLRDGTMRSLLPFRR